MALGYEYGDMVCMDIAGQVLDVPICAEYNDVDIGALVLRVVTSVNNGNNEVIASVSGGDLATWLGIAKLSTFAEDPCYRWDFIEPYGEDNRHRADAEGEGRLS